MIKLKFLLLALFTCALFFHFTFAQDYTLSDQWLGSYITVGIAWGDYDNDGHEDIYMSNGDPSPLAWEGFLFRNNGDGTFTQITDAGPLVTEVFASGGCSWGDYDNDGYLDLVVAEGQTVSGSAKASVYRNDGDGTFSSANAGDLTATVGYSRIDPAWADANNDGLLDILLSNANFFGAGQAHSYFTNDGDGTFSSVSNTMTEGTSARGGVAWIDVDGDGDMDAVTCSGAPGQQTVLWINTGSDFKKQVLIGTGQGIGKYSQAASWGDYDNDGDFDLYITNYGEDPNPEANILFRNDGAIGDSIVMTRLDETSGVGPLITDLDYSIASVWLDVDNDGDLDLFVGNDGGYAAGYRSRLYINNNGVFTSETSGNLIENADFIRSAAAADIDDDGDLEIVVGRDGENRLFINNLDNGNNWAQFRLEGVEANKSAIGAIVKVRATIGGQSVWQMRDVSSHTGAGSQNSMRLHFGLGDATVIDELVIHWPGSGLVETLYNVSVNQIIPLVEGQASSLIAMNEPVPAQYQLLQNYPNPFNPDTKIRFHLPVSGQVQLEIFNVLGNKVATLVDGFKSAGVYEYTFRASDLSSGVYFYRLASSGFSSMKKMMVLK